MSDLLDEHIERLTKLKAAMRLQQEEAHLRLITAQGQAEQYRNALKRIVRFAATRNSTVSELVAIAEAALQ